MKKATRRRAHHGRSGQGRAPTRARVSDKQPANFDITYEIVQHDGGWAYKVNGAFSEAFSTHDEALAAAQTAAAEQERPGDTETIEYEDDRGKWHSETVSGRDRPHAVVKDTLRS